VAHALIVTGGKAPDVVVGFSTGAIGGAALAEILQSGEPKHDKIETWEYEQILDHRVVRFRQFVDASHSAPERILSAIFPDAYQIDSFEPLASLELPRLPPGDRAEREEWTKRKTGLVRLYNDLLSIDLPFGAVTRLLRRGLGIAASNALQNPIKRWLNKFVEAAKSWLVIGSNLYRISPLVRIFGSAIAGKESNVASSTAGSIIFKFRPIERLFRAWQKFMSFSFVLLTWVYISWAVLLAPFLLVNVLATWPDGVLRLVLLSHLTLYGVPLIFRVAPALRTAWMLIVGFYVTVPILFYHFATGPGTTLSNVSNVLVLLVVYLIPILLPLTPAARALEKTDLRPAIRDLHKGLLAFLYYVGKWTIVLIPVAFVLMMIAALVLVGIAQLILIFIEFDKDEVGLTILLAVVILLALGAVVFRPIAHYRRAFMSFRRAKKQGASAGNWAVRSFLDSYQLGPALAHNYRLKQFLIELFDPGYHGESSMTKLLDRSLLDYGASEESDWVIGERREINAFREGSSTNKNGIVLAVAAADVEDGKLIVLPTETPIVDGLLAATSLTPLFEPVKVKALDRILLDGSTIGTSPMSALVKLFRIVGLADDTAVHIYPVEALPISDKEGLGRYAPVKGQPFLNLVDIVMRALQLQRYRDATLERDLTKVVNRVITPGSSTVTIDKNGESRKFFRAFFAPIDLDEPPQLNKRMFFSSRTKRQIAIAETIADGCRASLEVMLARTLDRIRTDVDDDRWLEARGSKFVGCADAVKEAKVTGNLARPELATVAVPGCGGGGPGLSEICKHCAIKRAGNGSDEPYGPQSLRLREDPIADPEISDWPHEFERDEATSIVPVQQVENPSGVVHDGDPVIACLFSGGVFRGVFQMGVLNAFSMLNVTPKVVAGASVGSITAAMVARALSESDERIRSRRILELSTVYLGIDRFILTDRFADFIRNWTIRASETRFSLRQLDESFRKYDVTSASVYQRTLREVLAGLERLFYINPYQVNELVETVRNRKGRDAGEILKEWLQDWLDRMNVGEEVLGAIPLRTLIEEFVITENWEESPHLAPFGSISDDVIFLATSTNLTEGRLKLLSSFDEREPVTLIEGLLASSAFPGVFRPRRSWDLIPGTSEENQYIDGGVMDNLPLQSVLEIMRGMADGKTTEKYGNLDVPDHLRIPLRPQSAPHLMLAASLEVDPRSRRQVDPEILRRYWPELSARARELKYNDKLNTFSHVADNLQEISAIVDDGYNPLKVKVLGIKPQWLCKTFAFHPMLGFRRHQQAASIAHGCAATLLAIAELEDDVNAWGMRSDAVPDVCDFNSAFGKLKSDRRAQVKAGKCWLNGMQCPYSENSVNTFDELKSAKNSKHWLAQVHNACWKTETHKR
jgi:predicted acylesterase/phospholipase RssA